MAGHAPTQRRDFDVLDVSELVQAFNLEIERFRTGGEVDGGMIKSRPILAALCVFQRAEWTPVSPNRYLDRKNCEISFFGHVRSGGAQKAPSRS